MSYVSDGGLVAVHSQPNGRPVFPACFEEVTRIEKGLIDQLVRVCEIDRLDVQRAGRGQHDQVSVIAVVLDVLDQSPVGEQGDGVQRHGQCSPRRLVQ